LKSRLWDLADGDPELCLVFLEHSPGESSGRLEFLSKESARMTPGEQERLKWMQAQTAAYFKNPQRACELAVELIPKPEIPVPEAKMLQEWERSFLRDEHDPTAALGLYHARKSARSHGARNTFTTCWRRNG
jgi:hypothetical protein